MQNIQIDGTFRYIDNVKTLKIGDIVKLIKNPNNKINKEAVGAYTNDNLKIGYIPFKSNQIDLKSKYSVSKISLIKGYPQILISRMFMLSNIIEIFPKQKKINNNNMYQNDIIQFSLFLKKAGHNVNSINIIYNDENFIDLSIKIDDNEHVFYIVTKKYYEEHVFYYDELFNFELIPKNIYIPFQTHRLEEYITKIYKPIEKLLKSKKFNYEEYNISIKKEKLENSINYEDNISFINRIFNNVMFNGLAYNHTMKAYCYVEYYNENMIIEVSNTLLDENIKEKVLKLIISNKKEYCILNMLTNTKTIITI